MRTDLNLLRKAGCAAAHNYMRQIVGLIVPPFVTGMRLCRRFPCVELFVFRRLRPISQRNLKLAFVLHPPNAKWKRRINQK